MELNSSSDLRAVEFHYNEKSILPVSTALHGEFGVDGVTLSIPAIVGSDGVERIVHIALNEREKELLQTSAELLKKTMREIE